MLAISSSQNEFMTTISNCKTPFMIRFVDTKPRVLLELTNTTEMTLKSIEILTIFLKDDGPDAGPSRAHIRFDRINFVQPGEKPLFLTEPGSMADRAVRHRIKSDVCKS